MNWEKVLEIAKKWWLVSLLAVVGVGLVGYGLWDVFSPRESVVEIVKEEGEEVQELVETESIMVDVGGAVGEPGVVELPENSRIGEAIAAAGGLSEEADKTWVSKNLNLAAELSDGSKVYIPGVGEELGKSNIGNSNIGGEIAGVTTGVVVESSGKINLNNASVSELDSLWGIGEARAKQIIEARPFNSVEELTSKAGIPSNVYERIKDEVAVY